MSPLPNSLSTSTAALPRLTSAQYPAAPSAAGHSCHCPHCSRLAAPPCAGWGSCCPQISSGGHPSAAGNGGAAHRSSSPGHCCPWWPVPAAPPAHQPSSWRFHACCGARVLSPSWERPLPFTGSNKMGVLWWWQNARKARRIMRDQWGLNEVNGVCTDLWVGRC